MKMGSCWVQETDGPFGTLQSQLVIFKRFMEMAVKMLVSGWHNDTSPSGLLYDLKLLQDGVVYLIVKAQPYRTFGNREEETLKIKRRGERVPLFPVDRELGSPER